MLKIPFPKFDFDEKFHTSWPMTFWPEIRRYMMQHLHDATSETLCITELDAVYTGEFAQEQSVYRFPQLASRKWVGISHHVGVKFRHMCENGDIHKHIHNCLGVVVLSEYAKSLWKNEFSDLNVSAIHLPAPERKHRFDPRCLDSSVSIRSLGTWRRKYDIWNGLNPPFPKVAGTHEKAMLFVDFDLTFIDTIQFMDVVDASANCSVLECIKRNTPLLINPHPAVVEYLGVEYPFYFHDQDEANEKINNLDLIRATHYYLKEMDKSRFEYRHFLRKFALTGA